MLLVLSLASWALTGPLLGTALAGPGVTLVDHYFSDAAGTMAHYLDVAGTLGLVKGVSGAGGPCRYGEAVTRLELATTLTSLLELDPSFQRPAEASAPGGLPFTDAGLIPNWAEPAVMTCYHLGLLAGIPDGSGGVSFQPGQTVMGADALTMFLRALRNERSLVGGWPIGAIYRAYVTGLLSTDVVPGDWRLIEPLAPLSRAQLAYLATNALFCRRDFRPGPPGSEGEFAGAAIGQRLSGYSLIVEADLEAGVLTTSEGQSLGLATVVAVQDIRRQAGFVGLRVFWLKDRRGRVGYLRSYGYGQTIAGTLGDGGLILRQNGSGVQSVLLRDGRRIPCAPGVLVELNGRGWPFDPAGLLPDAYVLAVMDNGQAVGLFLFQNDLPQGVIRSLVFAGGGEADEKPRGTITASLGMSAGKLSLVVDESTYITLNGRAVDLSALREGDVFTAATQGRNPRLVLSLNATRDRTTGKVTNVEPEPTVAGLRWRVTVRGAASEGSTERLLTLSPFCDFLGGPDLKGLELTFNLDRNGEVASFGQPAPGAVPRAVRVVRQAQVAGLRLLTVEWLGSEYTLVLADGFESPPLGRVVMLSATADGTVASLSSAPEATSRATVKSVDPVRATLTLTRQGSVWMLHVRRIPVYPVPAGLGGGQVGPSLPLEAVLVGREVLLDDLRSPEYILMP